MSWTAIVVLAAGSYLFKALGLLVLGPAANRSAGGQASTGQASGHPTDGGSTGVDPVDTVGGAWPVQLGQLLPPALLAALVVSQTVSSGQELVLDARLAGVAAGSLAVWRGAPFWLVITIAAAVTALLRLVTG